MIEEVGKILNFDDVRFRCCFTLESLTFFLSILTTRFSSKNLKQVFKFKILLTLNLRKWENRTNQITQTVPINSSKNRNRHTNEREFQVNRANKPEKKKKSGRETVELPSGEKIIYKRSSCMDDRRAIKISRKSLLVDASVYIIRIKVGRKR